MIALVGGDVRCMPYATFGTVELAESAVRGLQGRRACLLGNHGVMATGSTLARAHAVAVEVENLAGEYLSMLSAGLAPQFSLLAVGVLAALVGGLLLTSGQSQIRNTGLTPQRTVQQMQRDVATAKEQLR